jgi:hypothetical protein
MAEKRKDELSNLPLQFFKEFTFILKFEENFLDSYHIKLIEVF